MNVLIAMDSFKGTLASAEAGGIVKRAFEAVFPDARAEFLPVADGGEGTVRALAHSLGGACQTVEVTGPMGLPVRAEYGLCGTLAVMEMAQASGLLLAEQNDPMKATTYGTGQMMLDALNRGAKRIILGIGGSATNDGGAGMAQALGVSLRDGEGKELGFGGAALGACAAVDVSGLDERVSRCEIIVACDVKNPLCGERGASRVYGPQKGATAEQIAELDDALRHFARVAREQCGADCAEAEGAGAAGGLGFGLLAFCGARLQSGIDVVLDAANADEKLKRADLVITGEGSMDAQSVCGKAPVGIARRARAYGVPVVAIAGQAREGFEAVYGAGICAVVPCVGRVMTLDEAKRNAEPMLYNAALTAARLIQAGRVTAGRV